MINYIIGIDGGGTKTKAIAYSEDGTVINTTLTGPGSAAVVSVAEVWHNVERAIDNIISVIDSKKYNLSYIQIGLSAFSILDNIDSIEKYYENKYNVQVSIVSDTLIACYSILKDKYKSGVVALAGTGIAIFGINNNETCLIGGWGHIIRELGSAYAAVHHFALDIIDHMESNVLLSSFEKGFLELLSNNGIKDLKYLFYYHSKDEIASYVTYIKDMAYKGNEHAIRILENEGKSLAHQVIKAINKLNLVNDFVIGLRGGFAQKQNKDIIKGFKQILFENNIHVEIIDDEDDPAKGTYYLAKSKKYI